MAKTTSNLVKEVYEAMSTRGAIEPFDEDYYFKIIYPILEKHDIVDPAKKAFQKNNVLRELKAYMKWLQSPANDPCLAENHKMIRQLRKDRANPKKFVQSEEFQNDFLALQQECNYLTHPID